MNTTAVNHHHLHSGEPSKVNRGNISDVLVEFLGPLAERFNVRALAIDNLNNPNLRLRVLPKRKRRLSAGEYQAIAQAVRDMEEVHKITPRSSHSRRYDISFDFCVDKNPTLVRSPLHSARVVIVGALIDKAIDILGHTPIMTKTQLQNLMLRECADVDAVNRAMRFLIERTLVNELPVTTSYYNALTEKDVETVVPYIISTTARLSVKGTSLVYPMITLLSAAVENGPLKPKSTRIKGRKATVNRRASAVTNRERNFAHAVRSHV